MNYKLSLTRFIELEEKKGIIENNGSGEVEIAIVKGGAIPKEDDPSNHKLQPHDKFAYLLEEDEKIYGRATKYIVNVINVSSFDVKIPSGTTPKDAYTKSESDAKFVAKEEGKGLSTNDFTSELKEKLEDIQQKLDDGSLKGPKGDKGEQGKSIYDLAKENGFKGTESEYMTTLHGNNATTPLIPKLINEEGIIKYNYQGIQNISVNHIKGYTAKTESDDVATLGKLLIKNLGSDTSLRVDLVTFFGLDDNEKIKGTTNPARRTGVVPAGSFPHLKELDPTLEKTFNVVDETCDITLELDYKSMTEPELASLTRLGATHIGFIEIKMVALPSNDEIVIRHFFNHTIEDNTPKELINLQQSSLLLNGLNFVYCDEMSYASMPKIQDDNTIYLVKNNDTGIITMKVYRP